MPLKIRIKPEGKLFVSGEGFIKNVGNRPMDVLVSDTVRADRPERAINKLRPPEEGKE